MFYSGGKAKKQNVNRIFGDYTKKKNVHEIESGKSDSYTDYGEYKHESAADSPRSRSRSRSRSRDNVSKNTESIYDDDDENILTERAEYRARDETTGYITTVSQQPRDSSIKYKYPFVSDELYYHLTDIEEQIEFELVIYRINTKNRTPFLEFLLNCRDKKCTFPVYHKSRNSSETLKTQLDRVMDQLFTTKYRYNGYFYDDITNKYYIFYEKYFDVHYLPYFISLTDKDSWVWVCGTEIVNDKRYVNIPIDEVVIELFLQYPHIMILQHLETNENIELPVVLYTGSNFCYTETMAKFGLRRESITSRYGPFYYFTNLYYSFRWGCYDYKNTILPKHAGGANNASVTTVAGSNKGVKHSDGGGITRYAVFTGKMKSCFLDDAYDYEHIKQYKSNKMLFENVSISKDTNYLEYLDKSSSFHSYDYSWTRDYNTIYNGLYQLTRPEKGSTARKKTDYNNIIPFWCLYDYLQFEQLSYYYVDTSSIPDTYDTLFTDYKIM